MTEAPDNAIRADVLPDGLTNGASAWPVVWIQPDGGDVNDALYRALMRAYPERIDGGAVVKVHVGERKNTTGMRPEHCAGPARFARERGASAVVSGDTTVAYTGPRGHAQNPVGDASSYLALAHERGWAEDSASGLPFVVLDRPSTSAGGFAFEQEAHEVVISGIERFHNVFLAGGFAAAGLVINVAHLTLHGLAGVAGCVKSIAMGCTSLRGKLRMHQSLLPEFDVQLCAGCGRCVANCPADALTLDKASGVPVVDRSKCIGCGECEAVCAVRRGAVVLKGEAITDWARGEETLPIRMADYVIGMMAGRWERVVHILHMHTVTARCDCLDVRQKPMLGRDLGVLVGRNPFAIDRLAGEILTEALGGVGELAEPHLHASAARTADYVAETYGILTVPPIERKAL